MKLTTALMVILIQTIQRKVLAVSIWDIKPLIKQLFLLFCLQELLTSFWSSRLPFGHSKSSFIFVIINSHSMAKCSINKKEVTIYNKDRIKTIQGRAIKLYQFKIENICTPFILSFSQSQQRTRSDVTMVTEKFLTLTENIASGNSCYRSYQRFDIQTRRKGQFGIVLTLSPRLHSI